MVGKVTAVQDDHKAIFVELEKPTNLKVGDEVNVSKQKHKRTLKQNSMYWAFISWCIHKNGGNLQAQGHFSVNALHDNIKEWIESAHSHDFPIDNKFTTTELDRKQFKEFFDLVSQELMVEILGVDTSRFWRDYEKYPKWSLYNRDDFKGYMDEIYHDIPDGLNGGGRS
jgi:hypothetical protein